MCDNVVCDNLYVTKLCVCVCDTVVCDNLYVTKLCVTKLDVTKLCGSVEVREEDEVHAGYRYKNKNPTQFCREINISFPPKTNYQLRGAVSVHKWTQICQPISRSTQEEKPTAPEPPFPTATRPRVEESDFLRPAILALLQGDPIALGKGLGQVDHQAAQHVAQHIPGRAPGMAGGGRSQVLGINNCTTLRCLLEPFWAILQKVPGGWGEKGWVHPVLQPWSPVSNPPKPAPRCMPLAPANETQEQGSYGGTEQQTPHFDATNGQDPNPPWRMSSELGTVFTDHTLAHPLNCRDGVVAYLSA